MPRGTERALMIARELGHPFVGPTGNKRRTFWEKLYGENLVPGMDKPTQGPGNASKTQAPRFGRKEPYHV